MGTKNKKNVFERFSARVTKFTGKPVTFISALGVILLWAVTGPLFDYSDTWQLIINTGTTIITFLMVFVIQQSQNNDTEAIQLKLNELIASSKTASNRLIDIEDLTEEELDKLKKEYVRLSDQAEKESDAFRLHSIDEKEKHFHKKKKESGDRDKQEEHP